MADQKPVTLEDLRDGLNALGTKFNGILQAFDDNCKEIDTLRESVRQMQAIQRDQVLRPGTANGAGGPVGGDVMVQLSQMAAKIAELDARPVAPLLAADHKKFSDLAMRRASETHQNDRMMYHSNPAHPGGVIKVVATDAEQRDAALAGYHPTLELAAKQALGEAGADPGAVAGYVEKLRKAMFKVA